MASPGKVHRRAVKRNCRETYRSMDKTMRLMLELRQEFTDTHPLEARLLELMAKGILGTQQNFVKWYFAVWGNEPSDWQRQ